jgi:prepilin-type processing-associated H-X9-DG protein/prepilin-type N-terminal cleavage/methylation domain-containing protein
MRAPRSLGFTLVELLVTITIIVVLAGIALPVMQNIRERGKATQCLSNMRQIAIGFLQFAQEQNGRLPNRVDSGQKWPELVNEHLNEPDVFACPSDPGNWKLANKDPISSTEHNTSYIFNGFNDQGLDQDETIELRLVGIPNPSETILLGEQINHRAGPSDGNNFYMDFNEGNHLTALDKTRHSDGANYAFCDGSVRRINAADYKDELWLVDKTAGIPTPP